MPIPATPTIAYRVYKNNGSGGPVDYTTIVAQTSSLSYAASALGTPSDTTFVVRAVDTANGNLEDLNQDARTRIRIDASGNDISAQPNPVLFIASKPLASGALRVRWAYNPRGQGGAPTGFKVWITTGGSVNYAASPSTTVAYDPNKQIFSVDFAASTLTDGTTYSVGVRAYNSTATETNTVSSAIIGQATGPTAVEALTVTTGDKA
jgi:hypothetical protein